MQEYIGCVVRATAGRDKEGLFCVIGVDQELNMLLLADGKRRKVAKPKRKKLGHVETLTDSQQFFDQRVAEKLRQGEQVTNNDIRRAIAAFSAKEV